MPAKQASLKTVEAFLATLDHPHKPVVFALRSLILNADPQISEGIKWNVPSFRTTEYFATFHLRSTEMVRIILHLGAKGRGSDTPAITVVDQAGLLTWLAPDRAAVTFHDLEEVNAKQAAFTQLIREWIQYV